MQQEDMKNCYCLGLIALVSFISFILFLCSWDTVETLNWGINCNSISKNCDQHKIYESGRYFITMTHYFISFPANLQNIEFSKYRGAKAPPLRTRTAEGLSLELHISFQYQLIKEDLPNLYAMSNLNHETTFIRIARDTILQAAGKYEAPQYWIQRNQIGIDMQKELDRELQKAYARCRNLQLLTIELPDSYESSIVETQVEVQNKKMKMFEQQAELIRQEIQIMKSDTEQQIKTINSAAAAEAYFLRQQAVAQSRDIIVDAEANAYKTVQEQTGLNGDDLNKYIFYLSMMDQKDAKLIVGLDNAMMNIKN